MKKNYIFFIALIFGVTFFASCEKPEGALYSGEPNKASFFGKSINLSMTGEPLEIPIGRTSTEGEYTAPVTLSANGKGYTDVFKIASPVSFAPGQAKTYVRINYSDYSVIDPSALSAVGSGMDVIVGLAFPFSLTIEETAVSDSNVPSINVAASSTLQFADHGTCTINSEDGWWGDVFEREIHKAEGANVYKIIKPFNFNSFAFMINSDNSITCPDQVIYQHSTYGPVSLTKVKGNYHPDENKVVLEVDGYTVSAGSFGGGVEIIYLP